MAKLSARGRTVLAGFYWEGKANNQTTYFRFMSDGKILTKTKYKDYSLTWAVSHVFKKGTTLEEFTSKMRELLWQSEK